MPIKNNADIPRDIALKSLNNFPRLLIPHMDLVEELGEKMKKKKIFFATEILQNWNEIDNFEKFHFVGWFRAALKRMGITRAIIFINLSEKQNMDAEMVNMLNGATEKELQAFRDGEDLANNHR